MKRLKAREDEIRDMILDGQCDQIGNQFTASVTTSQQNKLDMDAVRKALGPERVKELTRQLTVRMVRLSERELVMDE